MNRLKVIFVTLLLYAGLPVVQGQEKAVPVDFYGHNFYFVPEGTIAADLPKDPSAAAVKQAYTSIEAANYRPLIDSLLAYKEKYQLNDWLYYQLIRKVAQQLCPKEQNYGSYTFYKWFMLVKSGYDARLALSGHRMIFYVFNDEDISDIPFFEVDGKKYMCLNYHDYAQSNLNDDPPVPVKIECPSAKNPFSYKVTRMPDFSPASYTEKKLNFTYDHQQYHFTIKLNAAVKTIFANYPGVDFETYFNIPLSKETYSSLIPLLKKNIGKMDQKKGVDYLMRFTRYAFLYENDQENFGKEKRMSPEETLSSTYSDCDDRAALFFYLVKEIYNLPMIALLYPRHITMAVAFSKPVGDPIWYGGKIYSVCEATPEIEDLPVGKLAANLKNVPYHIVYHYDPLY
ncbi:hypothetical protein SAMN06265348_114113 [Pedobacter westerhofensis]|uniref:Transglutaminase-like superfamily protein n=1 Tax=Pedobacter westerhofensis TaxID=425512 RepID=A0A521FNE7_9SPHI|nr:hypothetical protein [Pedobacter westerhofensis]SMO97646.1 hypothetical protein SAMN06265348_114113 [Pedobacter westerhofensis]